jgi:ABC-type protease/lipase transport system fused ATPase/permease subunit
MATRMIGLLTGDSMRLIEKVLRILCYGVGAGLVLAGSLSVGGVVTATLLARQTSSGFRRAMSSWRNVMQARSAYERVKRHLANDEPASPVTQARGQALTLQIDDVSHRYDEQPGSLFRHVNLMLQPGELLCIVGPSGSGKSTLARILSGKMTPRSGMIRFGGVDIQRLPPEDLSRQLNYLPQDAHIFPGTIRENIAGVAKVSDDDIIAAAMLAGMHEAIIRLPLGYETEIGEGAGAAFSAGERQRIALARAFLGKPALIVLDEPEAHLDAAAIQLLNEALAACKSWGAMVVVTSHSDAVAAIADKAVVLKNSKASVYGSREEWRKQTRRANPRVVGGTSSSES